CRRWPIPRPTRKGPRRAPGSRPRRGGVVPPSRSLDLLLEAERFPLGEARKVRIVVVVVDAIEGGARSALGFIGHVGTVEACDEPGHRGERLLGENPGGGLGCRLLFAAVAAPRDPDVTHAAHLARHERDETAAPDNGSFEGKLRCEQPFDLLHRGNSAGLVVVEDDAAIPPEVDAVGAHAEAEAAFHCKLQLTVDFGCDPDDAVPARRLGAREPPGEAREAWPPKRLDARRAAKRGEELVG